MPEVGIRELLEAGVHFGHQTRRWNPKMRRFIFGERDGIYIIDLTKTAVLLERARAFAYDLAARGGIVLFVGTKKQAKDAIKELAEAAGMPYVNERWLGGLLTNFHTISKRIDRLHDLHRQAEEGQLDLLPTKERMSMQAELRKLELNLSGVQNMERIPDAIFVVDLNAEEIAVREAGRLNIQTIGLVDTNCDPQAVNYVIPGNDDAMRSCEIVIRAIGGAVAEARGTFLKEEQAKREAEEQAKREAEEKARREAEAAAQREAEEKERLAAAEAARAAAQEQGAATTEAQGAGAQAPSPQPAGGGTSEGAADAQPGQERR
jgi:small subunit ribosomal protein S2